jgi:hypothetical protein
MSTVSKKIVLAADGASATVTDAEMLDIVTTLFSTNEAVTGSYGLIQRAGLFVGGMSVANKRAKGTWNPIA